MGLENPMDKCILILELEKIKTYKTRSTPLELYEAKSIWIILSFTYLL